MAAAVLTTFDAIGFNVQPLLALGGFGSVILGFASQQLLGNALSAVQLVRGRPDEYMISDRGGRGLECPCITPHTFCVA